MAHHPCRPTPRAVVHGGDGPVPAIGRYSMDEKDFALLRALKECGNITHAADRLYLTQSALSKRIKGIERELDCELIIRTRKGVRLTPAGELALERTSRASEELDALRHDLASLQGEVRGTLRAGFSVNYAFIHLPDLIAEYRRRYPLVQLNIVTARSRELFADMQNGKLDLIVLRGEYPWDGMRYLLAQEYICSCRSRELQDVPLSDLTYINHLTDITHTALMTRWLRENDLANNSNRIDVSDLMTCLELVRRGIGWALLPEIVLDSFDGIKEPCTFANGEPFTRRMYVDCQKESANLPQVQALLDLIKTQYGKSCAHAPLN